ncbi:MAG: hypothetical protein NT069_20785, partial [Planctomycetota bacterium]|nr:hypothetical protein [Planctomycetota bacterium]
NLSRYVANSVTHNIDPTGMFDEPLPNSPNATPTIFEPSNQLPSGVGIAFPATASPPPPFSPLQGLSPSPDPSIRNLEQLHTRLAQESRDAYFRALHPMFLYGGDYQMTHRDAQMRLKLNAQYSPFGGMSPNYAKAYLEYHVEQLNAIAATEYYRSQQEQWLRAHLSTPWLTFAGNTDFGNNYSARAALQMRRELPDFRVLQKWDMEHWINLEFGLNYTHMSNHPWEPNASVQYGIQANDRINLSFGASQGPGATGLVPNLKITITPPTPAEIKSKLRKVLR